MTTHTGQDQESTAAFNAARTVELLGRWQFHSGQLGASSAAATERELLCEFLEAARELIGADAAVVAIQPHSRSEPELIESVGLDARIAIAVHTALTAVPLALQSCVLEQSCVLSELPQLRGTLLLGLLEKSVLHTVRSLALFDCCGREIGAARFFFSHEGEGDRSACLLVESLAQRAALALERRWLHRASTATSAHMQALLDGALDAVVIADAHGVIRSANHATLVMFGFSAADIDGAPLAMILPDLPELDAEFINALDSATKRTHRHMGDRATEPNTPVRVDAHVGALRELEGRRHDGSVVPVELSVSRTEGSGGLIVIMRDVSARKQQENIVRNADRLATIGTLAAGLGHDMNNVLLPVRAHLNALDAQGVKMDGAERHAHIDEIRGGVGYLQHLADALHFLAMDPEAESDAGAWTDLADWWAQTGPLLSKSLPRGCVLDVDFPSGLPPVAIAPHALTRAMLNVLVNAGEAMPPDRPASRGRVVVCAGLAREAGFVDLEVIDNGTGMSKEVLRRASEMFYTTKPRGLGTGLGLPLVRGVAERAGGRLEVESREGAGTTVRLHLPAAVGEADTECIRACATSVSGRTAALLELLLSARGIEFERDGELDMAEYWICGADAIEKQAIAHWKKTRRADRIIIVGRTPPWLAREAASIGVSLVPDPSDLAALERALDQATTNNEGVE